jgi:quercetin dioxygenase-like cupin family protein
MKRLPALIAVALLPLVTSASPPSPTPAAAMPPMSAHVMLQAAQLQWGAAPPAFEKGAQAVVLSGDPGASGPFVLRLKTPPGFKVAMHWHPTDEQVTVIQGDLTLSTDDGSTAQRLDAGGYALMPAKMHHAASTKGGAIVQVSGTGPFEITYVNTKDDPRNRPATK